MDSLSSRSFAAEVAFFLSFLAAAFKKKLAFYRSSGSDSGRGELDQRLRGTPLE